MQITQKSKQDIKLRKGKEKFQSPSGVIVT